MLLFARPIAQLFLEDNAAAVLDEAVAMIRTEACFFWALGAIWAVNSALRGMGLVKAALVSSVVELVCKIGVSILLPLSIGSLASGLRPHPAGCWADPFGILSVPLVQPPRKRGRIRPRREKPPAPPGGTGGFCLVTVWKDYLWKLPWP